MTYRMTVVKPYPEVPSFPILSRSFPRRDGHQDSVCCSFPPPEYDELLLRLCPGIADMSARDCWSSGLQCFRHHPNSPPDYHLERCLLQFALPDVAKHDCELPLPESEVVRLWFIPQSSQCRQYRSQRMREELYHRQLPLIVLCHAAMSSS